MPAAAARQRRTHHHHYREANTMPAPVARRPAVVASSAAEPLDQPDLEWHSLQPLVRQVALDAPSATPNPRERAVRVAHRPLQWSWSFGLAGSLLLSQLVILLWLQACLLSARNHRDLVSKQMAGVRESMARTQKQIAAVDSQTRVAQWAAAYGWRPAAQADIDAVASQPATVRGDAVRAHPADGKPVGATDRL